METGAESEKEVGKESVTKEKEAAKEKEADEEAEKEADNDKASSEPAEPTIDGSPLKKMKVAELKV